MLHTIENEGLICVIEPIGAEIRSIINKETQEEYIWKINNLVWGSSSPILFPSIGNIKSKKMTFKGKEYKMPKHGIIRNNSELHFNQISESKCSFTLVSSELTKKQYPYDFSFMVIYELIGKRLIMTYHIENRDSIPMSFSCGGHTAYACPFDKNTKLSDYVIEFPNSISLQSKTLGTLGMLTNQMRSIEIKNRLLPLSNNLFNEDALVFANINFEWVRLRRKNQTKGVKVLFIGYPHLALWSKPGADFVCIEPWLGLPDSEDDSLEITEKSTYMTIDPDKKISIAIETEIE